MSARATGPEYVTELLKWWHKAKPQDVDAAKFVFFAISAVFA